MLLKKIVEIKGIIHCDSGLRIGGSKDFMEIGGVDSPIIRHPITEIPYIPGSSLKGKVRSLLESVFGRKHTTGLELTHIKFKKDKSKDNPCMCGKCTICKVFGAHNNTRHNLGPTRILVRDAELTNESMELLSKSQIEKGILFSEVKPENSIKRESGTAYNPRLYERVPSGTTFNLNLTLKIYDHDKEEELIDFIKKGLALLEADYLGSSGSRGYGKISLRNLEFRSKNVNEISTSQEFEQLITPNNNEDQPTSKMVKEKAIK